MALPDRPILPHPHPAAAPMPGRGGVPAPGRKRMRRQPPGHPGGPAWRERRGISFALSLALHGAALLAMLMTKLPAPPVQEAQKPPEVIEVEFVEVPAVKPAKAAAPPPVVREAPKPVAEAPVKPALKPKPVVAAAPKPAAPVVAKPRPATRVEKPAPRQADIPVKRAPSQAQLAQLAAARLKRGQEDIANRLAQIQPGADQPDGAPAAPEAPAGRPQVSNDSPMGELAGRGILAAPKPAYPEAAKRRVWEGTVYVRVFVGPDGSVSRASVERSSGFPILDASARGAAAAYRFSPLADGEGATQSGVIPFSFVIQ